MNTTIKIRTENGNYYYIHPNREIERCDSKHVRSSQWTATGVVMRQRFGRYSGRLLLENILIEPLTFKNGKARFHLTDLDHGYNRVWGDGIVAAWKIEAAS
jgi:hypothetical protein